jgi:hypothetical protein
MKEIAEGEVQTWAAVSVSSWVAGLVLSDGFDKGARGEP